jgi:prevent-host-death family protein
MTMVEGCAMRTMAAGKFKAQCLAVMDEVQAKREPVIVTKNGKPVAKLVPLEDDGDPLAAFLFPGLKIVGDIESPQYTDAEWNEFLEREARHVAGDED